MLLASPGCDNPKMAATTLHDLAPLTKKDVQTFFDHFEDRLYTKIADTIHPLENRISPYIIFLAWIVFI